MESAQEYKRLEAIHWPVLVDELEGTVHRAFGEMAAPSYLIDVTGRVAFYGMWTSAPRLKQAIDELLARGGDGPTVAGGVDRAPHLFAALVNGWRALKRGCARAVLDYELAIPGAATLTFLGHVARPLLAPLALRATPLPAAVRLAVGTGLVAGIVALVVSLLYRRAHDPGDN